MSRSDPILRVARFASLGCLALALVAASPVLAHAPLPLTGGEGAETATVIPDATKSWAIYSELPPDGHDAWFRFDLAAGDPLQVQLYVPPTSSPDFMPGLEIEGPDGFALDLHGEYPERATFEAFAPSSFRELAYVSQPAPATGTYLVRVESPGTAGKFGLAVGVREQFTADEWASIPFRVYSIHLWEGQSPIVVFGVPLLALLAVASLVARRLPGRPRPGTGRLLALVGGILILATAIERAAQGLVALAGSEPDGFVIVTAFLVAIPALVGLGLVRIGLRTERIGARGRVSLLVLAALGAMGWGGWLVGPAIALIGAFLPTGGSHRAEAEAASSRRPGSSVPGTC